MAVALLATLTVCLIMGCASQRTISSGGDESLEPQQTNAPLYYDFGDVLVPREMEVDKGSSFVFRTPGLSAGVLSMTGRVESQSLIAFFENNMVKDNWSLVSAFKSYRNILLFKKENRWCVIHITENKFSTHLEIWVSPSIEGSPESELLK